MKRSKKQMAPVREPAFAARGAAVSGTRVRVAVVAVASALQMVGALAQSAPRIPRTALPSSMSIVSGNFGANQFGGTSARPTLSISQLSNSGILNWGSFDIGADATVNIAQPSSTAMLLNKIVGGVSGTTIEGMLNANGHVYIYNPNGIIFGKTAQINVGAMVATTLKIDDNRFLSGITAPNTEPVFAADRSLPFAPGAIAIEGERVGGILQQAGITAAKGGRILMVAPQIANSGRLVAPDGQVMLVAAKDGVYLNNPADASMRGLRTEVSDTVAGASVTNAALGVIDVGRGNATLAGMAVNQEGVIKATTSVNLNGSIYLKAQGGASKTGSADVPLPSVGGTLVLGSSSETRVNPDTSDATKAPDDPAFKPSQIYLSGADIELKSNARVVAKSGDVRLTAGANPASVSAGDGAGTVTLRAGAVIDVSGTTDTTLAMESNVIEVELRSQLADNPLLRNSALRGQKVKVDVRKGTGMATLSDDLNAVQRTLGERTAAGGSVAILAGGQIAAEQGSQIDVSGGKVTYNDGIVATTKLTYQGGVVDIGNAVSGVAYDGILGAGKVARSFEKGYVQGYDAGTIAVSGKYVLLDGDLTGGVYVGARQRDAGKTSASSSYVAGYEVDSAGNRTRYAADRLRPLGGRLDIGNLSTGLTEGRPDLSKEFGFEGDIAFSAGAPVSTQRLLNLDVNRLIAGGMSRIRALTKGSISVADSMTLGVGGELMLGAQNHVELDGDISSPGGKVTAVAGDRLSVGEGLAIDVAGRWTSDRNAAASARDADGNPTTPVVLKGGSVSLTGNQLTLGDNARIDVSAGAWLDGNRKLSKGTAGSIALDALTKTGNGSDAALRLGNGLALSGYGFSSGGSLKLTGRDVFIGDSTGLAGANDLALSSAFFQQGGFTKYNIQALRNLTLVDETTLAPRASSWVAARGYESIASGGMAAAVDLTRLDLSGVNAGRPATSVNLAASTADVDGVGRVVLGNGSEIRVDPGAKVSVVAGRQLTAEGEIDAPGGTIVLGLSQNGTDTDYRAERSIWIGSDALLSAQGTADLLQPGLNGTWSGEVFGGGTIQIGKADKDGVFASQSAVGYVVAEQGARFDVSGTSVANIPLKSGRFFTAARDVTSDGGSIDIRAREGLLFDGTVNAASGGGSSRNGSLSLALDRDFLPGGATYPQGARQLVVTNDDQAIIVPAGLQADQAIVGLEGRGVVKASRLNGAGLDRLTLKSQNQIVFDQGATGLALHSGASLVMDAPALVTADNGTVTLSAPYVSIGNRDTRYQSIAVTATAGSASLNLVAVNADGTPGTVDLVGPSVLKGFGTANLQADDVRLVGVPSTTGVWATGAFTVAGNLNVLAAQTYVTTLSDFSLEALGGVATFTSNGRASAMPLSAGGRLSVTADVIRQNGVLRAPFGTITLDADTSLSYGSGSLTSVSGGSTTVPFGYVQNDNDWLYDYGNGNIVRFTTTPSADGDLLEAALPEKSILSRAPEILQASGATLDLAGGGELYAYQFTPGPGGSKDVLAKSSAAAGAAQTFAILPGFSGKVAPVDPQYGADGGLLVGDSIYLSAANGLAAGYYTLLPAHYALLPGAFTVTAASGTRDMSAQANAVQNDGSLLVAGYTLNSGSGHGDSRWSGFNVQSSSLVRNRSEFADYRASRFFSAQAAASGVPRLNVPADGGRVAFDAGHALALAGLIRLDAASSGRRGDADISADEIHVVSSADQGSGSGLTLVAGDLATIGAESLLLGGLRARGEDGKVSVTVGAEHVTVGTDAAHPLTLSGKDIILAASDTLTVKGGASIVGSGEPGSAPSDLTIAGSGSAASGALVRVTGKGNAGVVRDVPATTRGTLTFEAGSSIAASGAVVLDATKDTLFSGAFDVEPGAALTLGARRISLGENIPVTAEGLSFDAAGIAAFNGLTDLSLTSYTTLDFYGDVALGNSAMVLTLGGQGIQGYGTRHGAISGKSVTFKGAGGFTLQNPAPASVAGNLTVSAEDVQFAGGSFRVAGYSAVTMDTAREARGAGGSFSSDTSLTLNAGRITAASGTESTLSAGTALTLGPSARAIASSSATPYGGKLKFVGDTINSTALIEAHSGRVEFSATNGIDVSAGKVDVSGVVSTFGTAKAYAPGGTVVFDTDNGNVVVGTAATVDVSATGAAAGRLDVAAKQGAFVNSGHLLARSTAVSGIDAQAQGSFSMDVGSLSQFGVLNAVLDASGFAESRRFRLRNGDISLAAGETVRAHEVQIVADNGDLTVNGLIDATGVSGGAIELYASQANAAGAKGRVSVGSSARLNAFATEAATESAGSTGDGGRIVIGTGVTGTAAGNYLDAAQPATTNGGSSVSLAAGAVLDVSGSGAGHGGSVRVRAPRTADNADVAVSTLAATVIGARETVVEGYQVYSSTGNVSIGTAADTASNSSLQAATTAGVAAGKMYTGSNNFLSSTNLANMRGRLGTAFDLQAGVEVRAGGNISVNVNETSVNPQDRGWNLNAWRFGGQPGRLALRAAGNLNVNGSISDGFVKPALSTYKISMPGWELASSGTSWSYGFAAGADLGSAYDLAVKASDTVGDFKLGFARTNATGTDQAVAMIRTGTGRIDVAAGRDVMLATLSAGTDNTGTTVSALGAAIYTAGVAQAVAGGFTAPTTGARYAAWGSGPISGATADSKIVTARFTDGGGAISIHADRDVIGASTPQLINQWLFRQGRVDGSTGDFLVDELTSIAYNTAWWTRFDYFNQNVATFGGGNVSVTAGRDISDFSASVATSAYVPGASPIGAALVEYGGGDLSIKAGADIRGGVFYVQKGTGVLDAGGDVTYGLRTLGTGVPDPYPVGHPEDTTPNVRSTTIKVRPVLALGDGSFSVTARGDVEIQTVLNPTLVRQSTDNAAKYSSITSAPDTLSAFSTYSEDSAVSLLSLSGDVRLVNDFEELISSAGKRLWDAARSGTENNYRAVWLMYPGTVSLAALSGDVEILRGFTLAPSATGNLSILADQSVAFNSYFKSPVLAVTMLDVDPASMPNPLAPRGPIGDSDLKLFNNIITGIAAHTQTGLHASDGTSAVVYARQGNVTSAVNDGLTLVVPKPLEIHAGGNVENVGFSAQHLSASDVTRVTAGGDIVDVTDPVREAETIHTVSGPGRVEFVAGGDIDLGNGKGIVTRGNLDNPYLAPLGASVTLASGIAGATIDYVPFLRGVLGMTGTDAQLRAYADANQVAVLDRFFDELAKVTGATGTQSLDLAAFDAVIAQLFPVGGVSGGDINVFGSQVKTEQGGSVDLLAPNGSVYAGLASVPKYIASKAASKLGIFTVKGGEIRSLVKQNFQVNQGRVFTLGGNDITLVSQYGNIDAGRGSKTSAATPPPVLSSDENGNAVLDISGSISGSGIATLQAYEGIPSANVYPIAPRGIFDAGDAGLRASGTVSIVAQTVLNAGNIAASAGVSGLGQSAAVAAPPPAPASTNTSTGGQELTKGLQQKESGDQRTLTVELLGYGASDGQQNVTQGVQTPAPSDTKSDAVSDDRKKKKPQ